MLQQTPAPPGHEVSVTGSLEGWELVLLLLVAGTVLVALLWPLIRALARRVEGGSAAAELRSDVDTLREKVQRLEEVGTRVAELEERVDFAERLLAQTREPDRLQR